MVQFGQIQAFRDYYSGQLDYIEKQKNTEKPVVRVVFSNGENYQGARTFVIDKNDYAEFVSLWYGKESPKEGYNLLYDKYVNGDIEPKGGWSKKSDKSDLKSVEIYEMGFPPNVSNRTTQFQKVSFPSKKNRKRF